MTYQGPPFFIGWWFESQLREGLFFCEKCNDYTQHLIRHIPASIYFVFPTPHETHYRCKCGAQSVVSTSIDSITWGTIERK